MVRTLIAAAVCACVVAPSVTASGFDEPRDIALWPGEAPGSEGLALAEVVTERSEDPSRPDRALTGILRPRLEVYRPATPNGSAVIIVPGGAYQRVVVDKEGRDAARWLAGLGVTAFVLVYRLPEEGADAPAEVGLRDARRAVRIVRSRATAVGVDPERIGVLGFSAGGHLAGLLAQSADSKVEAPIDDIDQVSSRPNFAILLYPVVAERFLHPDLLARHPGLRRVVAAHPLAAGAGWPPTFLLHAADDSSVFPDGSLALFSALQTADVEVELHVFASGGHGFGLRYAEGPLAAWPELCFRWMQSTGLLVRSTSP